jgi:hypothetical protein
MVIIFIFFLFLKKIKAMVMQWLRTNFFLIPKDEIGKENFERNWCE